MVGIPGSIIILLSTLQAYRRRRRFRALLASGRIGIVFPTLVVAPLIVENDELQNEHERHVNDQPRHDPPPSYQE